MSTIHYDVSTPGPPQLQEVDDGVFAYIQPDGSWWINNTGFLVGRRGVVSIDTCATGAPHPCLPGRDPNTKTTGLWRLYWCDRNLKCHRYHPLAPGPQVQDLLDYLEDRTDPIFWG